MKSINHPAMKSYKLFILFILIFCAFQSNAQENVFKYAKTGTVSDPLWTECDTLGNNYIIGRFNTSFQYQDLIVTGNTSFESGNNIFVFKSSPAGNPVWMRSIRGAGADEGVNFVSASINNKGELAVIVSASDISGIYVGDRLIPLDITVTYQVLIKFTKKGYVNWVKPIKGSGSKAGVYVNDIKVDDEGSVILAGYFTGDAITFGTNELQGLGTYPRMFISKYYSTGTNAWLSSCNITPSVIDTIGGITATSFEICSNGTIMVIGSYQGTRTFTFNGQELRCLGATNAYLASFNSSGKALWAKPYEGDGYIQPNDVEVDENGNVLFTCFFQSNTMNVNGTNYSSSGDYDLILSKYTIGGISEWDNRLNVNLGIIFENYFQARAGFGKDNVSITGVFNSGLYDQYYFISYNNASGAFQWQQLTSNTSSIYFDGAKIDKEGNIYFYGSTSADFSLGGIDVLNTLNFGVSFFGKVTDAGAVNYIFTKHNDGANNNYLYFKWINLDVFGNISLLGDFTGTNVTLGDNLVSSNFSEGMFVSRFGPIVKLGGKVFNLQGNAITSGYVKLIGYSYYQQSPIVDSVIISNDGSYLFSRVPFGRYLIQAFPGKDGDIEYFPAYFPSSGHWVDAEKIEIVAPINLTSLFISVPQKPKMTGEAKLTGLVTETDETDVFKSTQGKASPKAKAKLAKSKTKSDLEIVAETETDNEGNFSFDSVEDGDYLILIEVAGLPIIDPYDVSVSGGMFISNLDYVIGEETITSSGEPTISKLNFPAENGSISVFPNPGRGNVTISLNGDINIHEMVLTNLQGKIIQTHKNISDSFNLMDITAGIYFLTIQTSYGKETIKLVIKP